MPLILNLGAGSINPLQKYELQNIDEFRDSDVQNLDIYNQIVPYTPDRSKIPFPGADIRYSDVEKKIDLADGTVDMAIAVSPYNYAALNLEIHRVLKTRGIVLVMGSKRNKYVTKREFLCSPKIAQNFSDLFAIVTPNDFALECVKFIAARGSHVSSGKNKTKVDYFSIYAKI